MDIMNFKEPIKMNRSTHYGSNYYEFKSRKLNRVVTAFSNLEYWNQIYLEMDPTVEKYCEQPYKAEVYFDGNTYETIFDVWVKYTDGREEFQEIKPSEEIEREDAASGRSYRQIAIQKAWCEQNGKKHVVRTDKEILLETHYMRNLQYLYYKVLRLEGVDCVAEKYIINFITDNGIVTVGQLINSGIISKKNGIVILAYLYCKGEIYFNDLVDTPFTYSTEVYVNGK